MQFDLIKKLLRTKTGLSSDLIAGKSLPIIIEMAMQNANCQNENEYFKLLSNNVRELSKLIAEIIVPETWFFRDTNSFNFLSEYLQSLRTDSNRSSKLRLLSAPCSTGEEPYSLAISLLESGFIPDEFTIDAFDISPGAIETARQAIYKKTSFCDNFEGINEKYFLKAEDLYILHHRIANLVKFRVGNLISSNLLVDNKPYDIIFSKNLLIYLNKEAQGKVISNLKSLLKDDGVLFVGHSELQLYLDRDFQRIDYPGSFACRKNPEIIDETTSHHRTKTKRSFKDKLKIFSINKLSNSEKKSEGEAHNAIRDDRISTSVELKKIQKLANTGKLNEAHDLCMEFIRIHNSNPDGYYELGLIHEAQNNFQKAEEYYHKALYLEPYHYETLVHLCLIFEQKGWDERASLLKKRIDKITGMQ